MESKRFDALTRKLAAGQSRRAVLKGLLGLSGSVLAAGVSSDQSLARRRSSSSSGGRGRCADGQEVCGTFCCDEGQCNQFENGCCDAGTTHCTENSTGCCALCVGERPVTCGYDCCITAEQCCGNECCNDGDVCIGEERCCTPSCDGLICGVDGCGGSCECNQGLTCCGDNSCVALGTNQNCTACGDSCDTNFLCGANGCERDQSTCQANLIAYGDLRECDLSQRDLTSYVLTGADLSNANLFGANLSFTQLDGASLVGTYLPFAYLGGTNLLDADLSDAELSFATWNGATCPDGTLSSINSPLTCCGHLNGKVPAGC